MENSIDVHEIEDDDAIEGAVATDASGLRVSAATSQRLKTISSYIEKLHDDIRLLSGVQESLNFVKVQLEKEKVDTLNFERISKNALTYVQNSGERELFGAFLDQLFPEVEAARKIKLEAPDEPIAGTSASAAAALDVSPNEILKLLAGPSDQNQSEGIENEVNLDLDDSVLDVEKGLNEPDLVIEDSESEEELLDLEINDPEEEPGDESETETDDSTETETETDDSDMEN